MATIQEQTFGLEVEMNSITRARAAQVIAEHLGGTVRHLGGTYDKYAVRDPQGRSWTVVSDSSIAGPYEERTELNTPVLGWDDLPTLQEVIRQLRGAGAKAHSSCGIHVHIGADEHTAKTLRNLCNIVNHWEDLFTLSFGISGARRSHWCKETDQHFLERLNRVKPTSKARLAQLWYNDENWEPRTLAHYDGTRYHLLNLHSYFQGKGVEFRAFNSTLHAGEIKAYIQLCMALNAQALNCASASPTRPTTDNPKYTFRCLLLRLGMNGDDFKTAREHLIKRLPGNAAWRRVA